MADEAVVAAVTSKLEAFLATNPVPRPDNSAWPFIGPNSDADTPADGGAFITLQFPIASENMVTAGGSTGNRLVREEGAIRLVASIPRGNGQDLGLQMIGALRVAFRFQDFSGVRTFGASPAVNNNDNDNGAYWVLSTSIPYWFDFTA